MHPSPSEPAIDPCGFPIAADALIRQIFLHSGLLVAIKDEELRFAAVSPRLREWLAPLCADPLGRTAHEVLPEPYAWQVDAHDRAVLHSGRAGEFEEQIEIDGRRCTLLSTRMPLTDAQGRVCGICVISTDISDRKRIEEALRNVALGVSGATGSDLYGRFARHLALTLAVDLAFIGVMDEGRHDRVQTLAIYHKGRFEPNMVYDLVGTPCQEVVGNRFHFVATDLQSRYQSDHMFSDMGLQSYAAAPLFDSRGEALGLLAVCHSLPMCDRDVVEATLRIFAARASVELERERVDRARQESEASYREIFEASEDGIYVHDFDTGRIVDVNPRVTEATGYSAAEMREVTVGDISAGVDGYDLEHALAHIDRARQGETVRFEWLRRHRNGTLHWDEVVLKPAMLAGRQRILAFTREISERKARERALQESESRLSATVKAALDPIISMDLEGRVLDFNPAAEACFGLSRESIVGRVLADVIIPPRFREAHRQGLERYRTSRTGPYLGRRIEVTAMRSDGREFPAELAISVASGPDGDIFIGYLRDIAERREAERARSRLEAQLRQAQKMEAIGHLTGGIAHDFNNILTSILGFTVLASEGQAAKHDARLRRHLEQIRLSGERARDLIRQMLTFSRGQRGEPRALTLPSLIKEAVKLYRSSFPASIEFDTVLHGDAPAVLADPIQAEQVLMNLCINARDAMRGVGRISIGVHHGVHEGAVCASCRNPVEGRYVELRVADTGSGVAPEIMERMFEPFFTTKEVGLGSGMGLATVHGIVHDHAGHILVESRPGTGSVFRILLPPAEGGQAPADVAAEDVGDAGLDGRCGRVLVVDDEASVRAFMAELLESRGFEVQLAEDGSAAMELLQAGPPPALVITDQTMPRIGGLTLAREVRTRWPDLPVIMYTGFSEVLGAEDVAAAGIAHLLRKPVDVGELFAAIDELLPPPG